MTAGAPFYTAQEAREMAETFAKYASASDDLEISAAIETVIGAISTQPGHRIDGVGDARVGSAPILTNAILGYRH